MQRIAYILLFIFSLSTFAYGQDVQRFSERHLMGTARYVGMGGSMTAIGGDPTAALDNPAGLGLYRRSELSLTLDETIDNSTQPQNNRHTRSRFAAPNISAIWALGNPYRQRGMIYSNFMLSANRLANFNRDIVVNGDGLGLVETICNITNDKGGVAEQYLQNQPWNDNEIGWLSILGYEAYLINPVEENGWVPAVNFVDGSLSISESGSVDQYTLS